jgi:lipoprotein-anchoring transpeptidase ErfK/SrfK
MAKNQVDRRGFLKIAALGLGGLALNPFNSLLDLPVFPQSERLGRVLSDQTVVKARPDIDSADVGMYYQDDVVPWLSEVVGKRPLWDQQRFVETAEGYIYSANLQPVENRPNQARKSLAEGDGFWAEVSVPYVDLILANPPARSPWLKHTPSPRLYYSQILWIDQIKTDDQKNIWYRAKEKYGTFGDIFWAPGEAFRPIAEEEISPIHPEVEDKHVEVDLNHQMLSCYEGNREVYFCTVSTGGKYDAEGKPSDKWATPVGKHTIWRKLVSVHMTGGTTGGGYDLPGIGWTTLFSTNGVAVHSTFWHNSYGIPRSHGCVNARPEDARWVFRWTLPEVPYEAGDVTVAGGVSTKVVIREA